MTGRRAVGGPLFRLKVDKCENVGRTEGCVQQLKRVIIPAQNVRNRRVFIEGLSSIALLRCCFPFSDVAVRACGGTARGEVMRD